MNTPQKNLTRYTREKTSFLGWRVCISRQGHMFTKYFADAAYENGAEGAYTAAVELRDEILRRLESEPAAKVLTHYRKKYERLARKERKERQKKRATRRRRKKEQASGTRA